MARQLVESMTGPWQPSDYRDSYTDRVNDLIEAKKNDEEFQPADEAPPGTNLVDRTEALRASVEPPRPRRRRAGSTATGAGQRRKKAGQAQPAGKTRSRKPTAKKALARKKSAKRPTRKRVA